MEFWDREDIEETEPCHETLKPDEFASEGLEKKEGATRAM